MVQNLLKDLESLLLEDSRFVSDGKILKNTLIEAALKPDAGLVKLLIKNEPIRTHFFTDIDGILIFDKVKFQDFVSNRDFLPNSYTAFKNKIGLFDSSRKSLAGGKDVVLAWAYKDCVLEGGMTKDDIARDEIFYNTTLAPDEITRLFDPKVLTKFEYWDQAAVKANKPKPIKDIGHTENLLIKGNNLLVLHSLKNQYAGKVKLIYIDPPYNPDTKTNTFSYNNTFNHSSWLTFMKNRLEVAKDLLTSDGALIVAIDDNEFYFLGCLLDELFKEYEIHCITIVHNPRGIQGTNFSYTHEYAYFVIPKKIKSIGNRKIDEKDVEWRNLRDNGGESLRTDAKNCFYGMIVEGEKVVGFTDVMPSEQHPKSQTVISDGKSIVYPIDPEKIERKWRYARQSIEEVQHLLRAKKGKRGLEIEIGKDFGVYRTVWQDPRYDSNEYGTKVVKSLVPDCNFSFPKSLYNVYDCLYAVIGNDKNATVLDFFGGSGTTAHALMELNKDDGGNRKFILVEQMDYIKDLPEARIKNAIQKLYPQESFIYAEIMEWNERYLQDIRKAKTTKDLLKLYGEMKHEAFFRYDVNLSVYQEKDFEALDFKDQQKALIDCLEMNHLYVNYSEIEDKTYAVSEADKKLNRQFYGGERE